MTKEEYHRLLEEKEEIEKRIKEYKSLVEGRFFLIDNSQDSVCYKVCFKQSVGHKYRQIRMNPFPHLENNSNLQLNDYIQLLIDDLESLKEKN